MKTAYNAITNNERLDISSFKILRPATKQEIAKANRKIQSNQQVKSYTKVRIF